jgi:hypothetical protein
MKLPELKKQPTPQAVLDEHFAALNACDWETQWVATAPFLAEPYRGSDAYITHDGYMKAMVSTFDGGALKKK